VGKIGDLGTELPSGVYGRSFGRGFPQKLKCFYLDLTMFYMPGSLGGAKGVYGSPVLGL